VQKAVPQHQCTGAGWCSVEAAGELSLCDRGDPTTVRCRRAASMRRCVAYDWHKKAAKQSSAFTDKTCIRLKQELQFTECTQFPVVCCRRLCCRLNTLPPIKPLAEHPDDPPLEIGGLGLTWERKSGMRAGFTARDTSSPVIWVALCGHVAA
jgi:hypothetical protein